MFHFESDSKIFRDHRMISRTKKLAALVTLLAVVTLLVVYLARIDDWLQKNEVFNALAMGLNVNADHPSLVALRDAGIENCKMHPGEDLNHCIEYQQVITQKLYFAQPIQGLFGVRLAASYGQSQWLLEVHRSAIWSQLSSALLAVFLWLVFTLALPPPYRAVTALTTSVLVLIGYLRRGDITFVLPDPIESGVQVWEGPALIVLAAVTILLVPRIPAGLGERAAGLITRVLGLAGRWWLPLVALILLEMLVPSPVKPVVQAIGLVLLFSFLIRETAGPRSDAMSFLLIAFLLLILISGDGSILLRKLEVQRYSAFLVFGAYFAYITLRPRGRLVWALPILIVFHASVSALLGLALVCAELPVALRRRRMSPVLLAGLVTFAGGMLVTAASETDLLGIDLDSVVHVAGLFWDQPWRLVSQIAVLALIGVLTLWPLGSQDPRSDGLVRIGILIMEIVVTINIRYVVLELDPALRVQPGYFSLTHTATHLNPGLAFGASLALMAMLWKQQDAAEVSANGPSNDGTKLSLFLKQAMILLLLIGIVKVNFKTRLFVIDSVYNVVAYAGLEVIHPNWCRYLLEVSGDDDRYLLSTVKPTSGTENYFSRLKLKTRIVNGIHDPQQVTVLPALPRDPSEPDAPPAQAGGTGLLDAMWEHFGATECVSSD